MSHLWSKCPNKNACKCKPTVTYPDKSHGEGLHTCRNQQTPNIQQWSTPYERSRIVFFSFAIWCSQHLCKQAACLRVYWTWMFSAFKVGYTAKQYHIVKIKKTNWNRTGKAEDTKHKATTTISYGAFKHKFAESSKNKQDKCIDGN